MNWIEVLISIGCLLATLSLALYLANHLYRRPFINRFNEKTVFITGCDSGIGHLLAIKLDQLGLKVFAGCLTESGAQLLRNSCSSTLKTVIVDITDEASIANARRFVESNLEAGDVLWGLVNNAGCLGNVCFELLNADDFRKLLDVNFFGVMRVINTFMPLIKMSKGRVVTVTSILQRGMFGACPYTCSKAALSLYCDALRRYLRGYGVHSSTVEPGFQRSTNLINKSVWVLGLEKQWAQLAPEIKEEFGEGFKDKAIESHQLLFDRVPLHWWNRVDSVVNAMVHALGSERPKDRYVCGWDAILIALTYYLIPDWLLDFALRRVMCKNWLS